MSLIWIKNAEKLDRNLKHGAVKISKHAGMRTLDLGDSLAEVVINPETKQIMNLTLHQDRLRFRCRRCATFCCKLSGPKLIDKDVEQIKQAGYSVEDFLEPTFNNEFKGLPTIRGNIKNREDGSCVFLKFDVEGNCYKCLIYDFRPALCKLYPFDFEGTGPNSFLLKLIPCCRGLNNPGGEPVNEEFIVKHLLSAVLDLMP